VKEAMKGNAAEGDKKFRDEIESGQDFSAQSQRGTARNIIHAMESGIPGDQWQRAKYRPDHHLLEGSVVEVPCLVDREGIHPVTSARCRISWRP